MRQILQRCKTHGQEASGVGSPYCWPIVFSDSRAKIAGLCDMADQYDIETTHGDGPSVYDVFEDR